VARTKVMTLLATVIRVSCQALAASTRFVLLHLKQLAPNLETEHILVTDQLVKVIHVQVLELALVVSKRYVRLILRLHVCLLVEPTRETTRPVTTTLVQRLQNQKVHVVQLGYVLMIRHLKLAQHLVESI
jgi:hypothetical protein